MLEELQVQKTFEGSIPLSDKAIKAKIIQLPTFATKYLCFTAVMTVLQPFRLSAESQVEFT
jgi:hypothetical protein